MIGRTGGLAHAAGIADHDDVRGEDSQQGVEVRVLTGGQEALDDLVVGGVVGSVPGPAGVDVLPGAMDELAYGGRVTAENLGDHVVRLGEHLAQHERRPFQR
jgi:hypothetical protein